MSMLKGSLLHAEPTRAAAAGSINLHQAIRAVAPRMARFRSSWPNCTLLYIRHSCGVSSMLLLQFHDVVEK